MVEKEAEEQTKKKENFYIFLVYNLKYTFCGIVVAVFLLLLVGWKLTKLNTQNKKKLLLTKKFLALFQGKELCFVLCGK